MSIELFTFTPFYSPVRDEMMFPQDKFLYEYLCFNKLVYNWLFAEFFLSFIH